MKDLFDEQGFQLPDVYRLTKIGKILRFFSLDEIPNMLNVLRGEMSIVGPRPLLVQFYYVLQEEQRKRYSVLPGITGLAQVSGRNNLSLSEKVSLDLKYISQVTLLNDLKICAQTFQQMFTNSPNSELGNQSIDNFTPKLDDN
jgi:lipopolysaccharide/colanic/teichoic acid biosynthesis glycosyltransferase